MGTLLRHFFGQSPTLASHQSQLFETRNQLSSKHLQKVGETFLAGYNFALSIRHLDELQCYLEIVSKELRGFAYEGAAMGLVIKDQLSPWRQNWFTKFFSEYASAYKYLGLVGAGWGAGTLWWTRQKIERLGLQLDPMFGWLLLDGYGFQQAYFQPKRYLEAKEQPLHLSEYGQRAFDMGIGRAIWFVHSGNAHSITSVIEQMPQHRQSDLCSGIGVATAYAGGVSKEELLTLKSLLKTHDSDLAQGIAFAAMSRRQGSNIASHTEFACELIVEQPLDEVADVAERALKTIPQPYHPGSYEVWRQQVKSDLMNSKAPVLEEVAQ